jgi:hypothetical protein
MNSLNTLYFPDTVLSLEQQLPLALFFHTLHLLQPVEGDDQPDTREEKGKEASDPGCYPFTEKGFCQVHTPSALGEDRDRFLHLLHDIRNKKDAYVEQLSYLTLASLSAPASRGDSSKQAILSSLLQGVDQDSDARTEQDRLALWQARLVLKIAEILDQEEEELAWQLATIDDQEIALFRRLQGEIKKSGEGEIVEEDPFQELLELKQKLNQPRPGMIRNRLRAWSTLYLSGPLSVDFQLWTTRRQEAADILLERYEKESGQAPVALLQIALPARISQEHGDVTEAIEQFRAGSQSQIQALAKVLESLVTAEINKSNNPAGLFPEAQAWQETWNSRVDAAFPANHYGRATLTIYLLPETSFFALIENDQGKGVQAPVRNLLLAVCV